jgi:hypothetical protein
MKKVRQLKSKVKNVLAGQTVNSAYYCDILWRLHKNLKRLPNSDGERTGCCIMTTHRLPPPFFTRESLTKNNMSSPSHPTHHFDTTEVIKAELLAIMNTMTEHNFQDTFKKWHKGWEWYICVKGTTSTVMMAGSSKVRF